MKIKLTLFLAFFVIIGFTSCEDNPLEGTFVDETGVGSQAGQTTTSGNSFFARVDGVEFADFNITPSVNSGAIYIEATDLAGNSITLRFPEGVSVGTYTINGTDYRGSFRQSNPLDTASAISGSITIDSHDSSTKMVAGKFVFNTEATALNAEKSVTEGVFNISYN